MLLDTGCTLLDPTTNREVLVANIESVEPLIEREATKDIKRGMDPADILTRYKNHSPPFRLIFCKSVTGVSDMLLAFTPDVLTLDGEERRGILIAITSAGLGGDDNVRAVIGAASQAANKGIHGKS